MGVKLNNHILGYSNSGKESPPSLRVDLELPTPGIPADSENSKGDDLQRTSVHINHQMMILHRERILL